MTNHTDIIIRFNDESSLTRNSVSNGQALIRYAQKQGIKVTRSDISAFCLQLSFQDDSNRIASMAESLPDVELVNS